MTLPDTVVPGLSSTRILEIADDLVAVDTSNPPGDTTELAEWTVSFFETLGLDPEVVTSDPAKPNVLATLPGEADKTLLYNGHLDTVPFGASAWSYDPLGERDGDRLYGRGATDMKGPLAAMLHVAETYVETGVNPPVNLLFAVVSDEETGGAAGVSALVEQGVFEETTPDACVIGETTCSAGRHSVTVADRGSIWLTLRAEGTAAHGSRPVLGVNAVDALWEAVSTIRRRLTQRDLSLGTDVRRIVDESVSYYEPSMGREAAEKLFVHPSVNVGTFEGGDAVNTVPDTARAQLDVRISAGVDTSTILADVRDCLEEFPLVSIEDASWSVGTYEPPESPLVESVVDMASRVAGDRIYRRSATGGGDAKKLRNAGVPTVEFAFGTDTVHAIDEYTTADALVANARVYAQLPNAWTDAVVES
ncbi:ArgE/DapE family deacylase [Halorubrum gandharaense]